MHVDWTIRPYDIFVFVGAMVTAVWAWRDLSWRIRNIESWRDAHLHSYEQALVNITLLREAVVKMEQIAQGQERRIVLIEDREDRHKRVQ